MRLFRIRIENFRNFRKIDCRLGRHSVILGENGAGKSNFLHALRLLLDPGLPDTSRYLDEGDFWDGGPAFAGVEVIVSVDLTDYEDEPGVLACLADHEVQAPPGWKHSVARLTYRYAPRDTVDVAKHSSTKKEGYDFAIYGGDERSNVVSHEVRRFLGFRVLNTLRDAEGDLGAWKRSPLRPLLETIRETVDNNALKRVAEEVDKATAAISEEKPLAELKKAIGARLKEMLGPHHALSPSFGFNSTDPRQLIQSLRLFVDENRRRQVSDTSLGLANVLYLSLLLLHTEQQEESLTTAATILGIEEPEAHLHPQMQRVVFRDLLRKKKRPMLVSTHSPNIASVAPVDSLVVLRIVKTGSNQAESQATSFANATNFTEKERADLERYLDVTRAEIMFGRGIILVEGEAEEFIVPAAARLLPTPVELDEFGITVCSVAGTDFVPHAKLLKALNIPFVIITDGDERDAHVLAEDDEQDDDAQDARAPGPPGIQRGARILEKLGQAAAAKAIRARAKDAQLDDARRLLAEGRIFVGARTLETDLMSSGAGPRMKAAYKVLFPKSREATVAPFEVNGAITDSSEDAMIKLAERAGKGRLAQCFAPQMSRSDVPLYIRDAINAIIATCRRD